MNLPERYMAMYVNYYNTHGCSEYGEIALHQDASGIYLGWQVPLDENIFKIKKGISSLSFRMYSGNLWKVVLMNQEIIDYILEHNVRNQFHTEGIDSSSGMIVDLVRTTPYKNCVSTVLRNTGLWVNALTRKICLEVV